jgi:hypothetical protein
LKDGRVDASTFDSRCEGNPIITLALDPFLFVHDDVCVLLALVAVPAAPDIEVGQRGFAANFQERLVMG